MKTAKTFIVVMAGIFCESAISSEVLLICKDSDPVIDSIRENYPSAGVYSYRFDPESKKFSAPDESVIYNVKVSDVEISFNKKGSLQTDAIKEVQETRIGRIDGKWIRSYHYLDSQDRHIYGDELQLAASRSGLTGLFGIRYRPSFGTCTAGDRKF